MANSPVVIDASIAIKAVLPNPLQAQCQALLIYLSSNELVAPGLNSLATGQTRLEKNGRICWKSMLYSSGRVSMGKPLGRVFALAYPAIC